MEREKVQLASMMLIIGILFGFSIGSIRGPDDPEVNIISIEDGQEVHSIVVVDAIFDKGDEVGVFINGTQTANYLPYYWNNMLYPVGDYDVAVGVYKNDKWTYDNVTVTIPEIFIVPEDYVFLEDFVVHTGQTVYMNHDFELSTVDISNGWNSVDELQYFSINNFGTLHINGNITCEDFLGEEDSITNWNDGDIVTQNIHTIDYGTHSTTSIYIRFDDNALLNINSEFDIEIDGNVIKKDGSSDIVFLDNASWTII